MTCDIKHDDDECASPERDSIAFIAITKLHWTSSQGDFLSQSIVSGRTTRHFKDNALGYKNMIT